MPRVFLIHRNNNMDETEQKGLSPEHTVSIAENPDSQMSENSSECPDELYNLTQLAKAAVAEMEKDTGESPEERKVSSSSSTTDDDSPSYTYTHKLFDKSSRTPRPHLIKTEECKQVDFGYKFQLQALSSASNSSIESLLVPQSSNGSNGHEHECNQCGKRYSTSSNLARHRQTHRSLADKKHTKSCPHCGKVYVSLPALSMHVRTHNQGCKCQFCGKCFSRPWLLQGHIRTHTGEKPFKCTTCNKAFADKSNLRAHIQTHSNTKPHICGRCGKAFALKSYLYKHEESSCMRMNARHSPGETTPNKNLASPTPVIVSVGSILSDSVIKGPDSAIRYPMPYRSTVISPNPKRLLHSTIRHPSVILNATNRFDNNIIQQEQPMDFSTYSGKEKQMHRQSPQKSYFLSSTLAV